MTTTAAPRLIKRYANRKMYDTERSCYVTLEEVAELVRGGVDVRVIDNTTKADLTEVTLAQALLDSQRRNRQPVSLAGLRTLISQGGDLLSRNLADVARARTDVERTVERTVEKLRTEAERTVGRVLHRRSDEETFADAETAEAMADVSGAPLAAETAAADAHGIAPAAAPAAASAPAPSTAGVATTSPLTAASTAAQFFDDRLRRIAESLDLTHRHQDDRLLALQTRVATLEQRLAEVEAALRAATGHEPSTAAAARAKAPSASKGGAAATRGPKARAATSSAKTKAKATTKAATGRSAAQGGEPGRGPGKSPRP